MLSWTYSGQKERLPEVGEKLSSYLNDTQQIGYTTSSDTCQSKVL
jgi:hypothetical protein